VLVDVTGHHTSPVMRSLRAQPQSGSNVSATGGHGTS